MSFFVFWCNDHAENPSYITLYGKDSTAFGDVSHSLLSMPITVKEHFHIGWRILGG